MAKVCDTQGIFLHAEIQDLKEQIVKKNEHIIHMETKLLHELPQESLNMQLSDLEAKYDRLFDSYKKLQKTNNSLEDKLLKVVDKFETEKNQLTRDLSTQTQKLVDSKLIIQELRDHNKKIENDLNLAIQLLQNKPNSFVSQRIDSLPNEMQSKVRQYVLDKVEVGSFKQAGKKIRVSIPTPTFPPSGVFYHTEERELVTDENDPFQSEEISAAILAKVLEERASERKINNKLYIDIGTQTIDWEFRKHMNGNNISHNLCLEANVKGEATSVNSSLMRMEGVDERRLFEAMQKFSVGADGSDCNSLGDLSSNKKGDHLLNCQKVDDSDSVEYYSQWKIEKNNRNSRDTHSEKINSNKLPSQSISVYDQSWQSVSNCEVNGNLKSNLSEMKSTSDNESLNEQVSIFIQSKIEEEKRDDWRKTSSYSLTQTDL